MQIIDARAAHVGAERRISPGGSPAVGVAQVQGFEWDPNKKGRNIRNRGLDLTIASRIWEGPVLEKVDARHDCGGTRIMAFGKVDGRLMAVLFTRRGSNRRTISAR
jgi:uncharacterized DUF497 family protein